MTHVVVNPGVCGLTADIKAESAGMGEVNISVDTKCKMIADLVGALEQPADVFAILGMSGGEPTFEEAREGTRIHAACPTIAGIVKAVEVASQMALPCDASITFVED
ncbi:MAG: hypothetical protein IJI68_06940 [Eggerthellaceae bacterium]|nr:hypothetical protein [Eggerthellaceae bacterium]